MALPTSQQLVEQYKAGGPLTAEQIVGLPVASPPSSVDQINKVGGANIPNTQATIVPVSNAVASNASLAEAAKSQFKIESDKMAQAQQMEAQNKEVGKSWLQTVMGAPSVKGQTTQNLAELGYDQQQYLANKQAKSVEIAKLNDEYQSALDAMNEQINAAMSTEGKTLEGAKIAAAGIELSWAPKLNRLSREINLKTAILNAEVGNYNEAYKMASAAAEAEVADYKYRADSLRDFYLMNQSQIESLKGDYQTAYTNAMNAAQQEYENQRQSAFDAIDMQIKRAQLAELQKDMGMSDLLTSLFTGGEIDGKTALAALVATGELNQAAAKFIGENLGILQTSSQQAAANKMAPMVANVNQMVTLLDTIPAGYSAAKPLVESKIPFISKSEDAANIATYNALRGAFTGPVARVVSQEVGVLTDRDIKRAQDILPAITDDEKTRDKKVENLRKAIQNIVSGNPLSEAGKSFISETTESDLSDLDFKD